MASFGQRLRELRQLKHLSQEQLADVLGISKQAVSQYERDLRTPKDYGPIADFFNVDVDYLLGRESKSTYYLDPETVEISQALRSNKSLGAIIDRCSSPSTLRTVESLVLLDDEDQLIIYGEIRAMLRADKYSTEEESENGQEIS